MKRQNKPFGWFMIFLLTILISFASADLLVFADGHYGCSLKIMPLGDSITYGSDGTYGGYRGYLHDLMSAAGYSFDFVGSQDTNSPVGIDPDHEGHPGWHADKGGSDDILGQVYGWIEDQDGAIEDELVDIVLLHIGTNDISGNQTAESLAAEVDAILDEIDRYESDNNVEITVFLAQIINRSNPFDAQGQETTAFNNLIQIMADARIAAGDEIIVVDMEAALDYPGDMDDNVHPNDTGYDKMADVWFEALDTFLQCFCPTSGVLPSQASSPIFPPNGATDISVNADLNWTAGCGATSHDVYFDTNNPPILVQSNLSRTTYNLNLMTENTTYYWRIDETNSSGTTSGVIRSFTTGSPPAVENVGLLSISENDLTTDDLMCNYNLAGSATTTSTAWFVDGWPLMELYMPMQGATPANALMDYSGNGRSPSNNGAVWDSTGGFNGTGGFYFENTTIYAGQILIPNGSYTKMARVMRTGTDTLNIISGTGNNSGISHAFWANCGGINALGAGHEGGIAEWCEVADDQPFPLNEWHHVAVTYDAGTNRLILYMDGTVVDSTDAEDKNTDSNVYIGGYGESHEWRGYTDEVRIYNFALSAAQIGEIYSNGGDVIKSNETTSGEQWQCLVTPFDSMLTGTTVTSNILTILFGPDFNGDGDVDGSDLAQQISDFGSPDVVDFNVFATQFGNMNP